MSTSHSVRLACVQEILQLQGTILESKKKFKKNSTTGLILGPANEGRRYNVKCRLIDCAQT